MLWILFCFGLLLICIKLERGFGNSDKEDLNDHNVFMFDHFIDKD